jgi:hypothetical protein
MDAIQDGTRDEFLFFSVRGGNLLSLRGLAGVERSSCRRGFLVLGYSIFYLVAGIQQQNKTTIPGCCYWQLCVFLGCGGLCLEERCNIYEAAVWSACGWWWGGGDWVGGFSWGRGGKRGGEEGERAEEGTQTARRIRAKSGTAEEMIIPNLPS